MKISRNDPQCLEIEERSWGWSVAIAGAGCFSIGDAIVGYTPSAADIIGVVVFVVVGLFFIFFGVVIYRRSSYTFDRTARQLQWKTKGLFSTQSGTIPFDQIKYAMFDFEPSDDGGTTHFVLNIADRETFQLTSLWPKAVCIKARDAINRILGLPADFAPFYDDVRAMVANGKQADAIMVIRVRRDCSFAEAKKFVESLK